MEGKISRFPQKYNLLEPCDLQIWEQMASILTITLSECGPHISEREKEINPPLVTWKRDLIPISDMKKWSTSNAGYECAELGF